VDSCAFDARALQIQNLRQLIGQLETPQSHPLVPFSLFPKGLPQSRLIEIHGPGKSFFVSQFVLENQLYPCIWVEGAASSLNPFSLWQKGFCLEETFFIQASQPADQRWSIQQILQSGSFRCIILSEFVFGEKDLRRFQLLSERFSCFLFLLSHQKHQSWVPALQLSPECPGALP
jgi:hypothetical protein